MPAKLSLANLIKSDGPVRVYVNAYLSVTNEGMRFQPTGFPELGIVVFKAPRDGGTVNICIVDAAASMANHLERFGMRSAIDMEIAPELEGIPYMRWFAEGTNAPNTYEYAGTTLNESHRMGSPTFYGDKNRIMVDGKPQGTSVLQEMQAICNLRALSKADKTDKADKKAAEGKETKKPAKGKKAGKAGAVEKVRYHVMPEAYWRVLKYIMDHDTNTLVHGGMFTRLNNMRLSRVLAAGTEGIGATRVSRSGVKFDATGITDSGQAIFSIEDVTADKIKTSLQIDVSQLRSYGTNRRLPGRATAEPLGLTDDDKKLVLALCFWKIGKLYEHAYRYRSNCDLKCDVIQISLDEGEPFEVSASELIGLMTPDLIANCGFKTPVTDVFLPFVEAAKAAKADAKADAKGDANPEDDEDAPGSDNIEVEGD